jgi:hypothetical protein
MISERFTWEDLAKRGSNGTHGQSIIPQNLHCWALPSPSALVKFGSFTKDLIIRSQTENDASSSSAALFLLSGSNAALK